MPSSLLRAALLALIASTGLSSCAVVLAGAGAGYFIKREVIDDQTHTARIRLDVDQVWVSVREALEILHDSGTELSFQTSPRKATCRIDGAEVEVFVDAYDLDVSELRVHAEKYLTNDTGIAKRVLEEILGRIE